MKIETKSFRVRAADAVKLDQWATETKPLCKSKKAYRKRLADQVEAVSDQQRLLYASNRHALLVVFQAMDTAGKHGAIRHVMSGVDPHGCQLFSFQHPSAQELKHDSLRRTTRDLPERGRIGIFNRSYYEEVLIVRVHGDILRGERLPDACPTGTRCGTAAIAQSSIWKGICMPLAPASSRCSCICQRKNSASACWRASTSPTRTGNAAPPTSPSASSEMRTCGLTANAWLPRALKIRPGTSCRPTIRTMRG